jgi:pimeloyl-ACP methyl ester carboxylesterase
MDNHPHQVSLTVGASKLAAVMRGTGRPMLYLHAENGPDGAAPVLDLLAHDTRLIAPDHPGYGNSPVDAGITGIDDIAFLYLDLLNQLDLRQVTVVGVGLGGWIAAQMAVCDTSRIGCLVLADAVGIKRSDRTTRDIVDIYALTDAELAPLAWADPALGLPDLTTWPEHQLLSRARARETTARYGWSPYLHDRKLYRRLARINCPTKVLWGEADRIVTPDYGRAYAAAIPGASFALITGAGHFPQLEQPAAFAAAVASFVDASAESAVHA